MELIPPRVLSSSIWIAPGPILNNSISAMSQLIIHADDFGLTREINAGILQAYLEGNLTSTSIMATGTAFEEAVEICQTVPTLDIGVHLTLVGEEPILNRSAIKSLVTKEGCFHADAGQFVRKYYCGQPSLKEIRCELEAQIQKVLNTGIPISHFDSHQHLHMLPRILDITVELAKKYNIAVIRFPYESFSFSMLGELSLIPRTIQMLGLKGFCYLGHNMDILRTDCFFGFRFGGNMNKHNLLRIIDTFGEIQRILKYMGEKNLNKANEVYVLASGYAFNDDILIKGCKTAEEQYSFCDSFANSAHVDKRDGLPLIIFQSKYIITTDPVEIHLDPKNNKSLGY